MGQFTQEKPTSFFWLFALLFFALYISTLTFEYYLFDGWFRCVAPPFRWLAEQTGRFVWGVNLTGAHEFYSDSLLVYVHLLNLLLISLIAAAAWSFFSKTKFTATKLYPLLLTLLRYFVSLHLFIYGFSKLYKWQFMLPEPNILYTTVGEMHRDILYWTSMGTSRPYSMFMGVVEIVPAILLLFRRTTVLGAFAAVLVMANVVAVNFSFDITVKLHSSLLLIMAMVVLIPARKRIVALFTGKAAEEWRYPALQFSWKQKWLRLALKAAAIVLLLSEAHYPYTSTGTFNDDASPRPEFHGAYEVLSTQKTISHSDSALQNETLPPDAPFAEKIFVHRRGYVIFQYNDGRMESVEQSEIKIVRLDDSTLQFTRERKEGVYTYTARALDWRKLPLLEEEFTWIDEE